MNANVITMLTANGNSFGSNAKEAGNVTLLGMVTIFTILALLWGIINLIHLVLEGASGSKKKKEESTGQAAPVQAPAEAEPEAVQAETDDGELVAAITAAISATMAEEGYTGGFRVVSFKRVSARRNGRN